MGVVNTNMGVVTAKIGEKSQQYINNTTSTITCESLLRNIGKDSQQYINNNKWIVTLKYR